MDEQQNLSRLEQLLEDTLELTEENNRMLMSMQRTARWSFWGKLILWLIALALPFIVLGPLVHAILPVSNSAGGGQSFLGLPSPEQFKGLLQAYKAAGTGSTTP